MRVYGIGLFCSSNTKPLIDCAVEVNPAPNKHNEMRNIRNIINTNIKLFLDLPKYFIQSMKLFISAIFIFSASMVQAEEKIPPSKTIVIPPSRTITKQVLYISPYIPDRAFHGYTPVIAGYNKIAIETGGSLFFDNANGFKNTYISYNSTTLRLGLGNTEIRLSTDFGALNQEHIASGETGSTVGVQPIVLGTKVIARSFFRNQLTNSIMVNVSLNELASSALKTAHPEHEIILLGAYARGNNKLMYNLGLAWDGFNPDVFGKYSLLYYRTFAGRYNLFSEFYGDWLQGQGMDVSLRLGGIFDLTQNWRFDIAGGFGFSDRAQDWFVSAGVSRHLNL